MAKSSRTQTQQVTATREGRLQAALRANLQRRKKQPKTPKQSEKAPKAKP